MKKYPFGLFGKIFLYTLLFLVLALIVFTIFYAQQLNIAFSLYERRHLTQGFQPLLRSLENESKDNIGETAAVFRARNESFEFSIQTSEGEVIYETSDFNYNPVGIGDLTGIEKFSLNEISFSIPLSDGMTLYVVIKISDKAECYADRTILSRVLSNVIMNAIQNAPQKSEIRIWSENSLDNNEIPAVRVCVLNTNTSIKAEDLVKLFDPFYRADKSRSRSQGRSGLGLTIVKKALDTMEAPFVLENTKDGVLFRMDLPMEE
ncbi:MAG: ATP-binding protein [Oscillospiraceae bacterium]|jgi:signal transduction histidine kinase|nr:ATP-binding protein [Oscillospiraceae bacterium]